MTLLQVHSNGDVIKREGEAVACAAVNEPSTADLSCRPDQIGPKRICLHLRGSVLPMFTLFQIQMSKLSLSTNPSFIPGVLLLPGIMLR